MTRRFVLRERAESDIRSAFEWYERQRSGLGDEYLASVRTCLERIREFPKANPLVHRNVRRAIVQRFPYLVFYVSNEELVSVLAVLHYARNPARWPRP